MPENYISIAGEKGSINISEDVISALSAAAICETEGVAGVSNSVGLDIAEILGKKNLAKGIKVCLGDGSISVDALIMVRSGYGIASVAGSVQASVINAVESMCGIEPVVNVHVTGVAFDK